MRIEIEETWVMSLTHRQARIVSTALDMFSKSARPHSDDTAEAAEMVKEIDAVNKRRNEP